MSSTVVPCSKRCSSSKTSCMLFLLPQSDRSKSSTLVKGSDLTLKPCVLLQKVD